MNQGFFANIQDLLTFLLDRTAYSSNESGWIRTE